MHMWRLKLISEFFIGNYFNPNLMSSFDWNDVGLILASIPTSQQKWWSGVSPSGNGSSYFHRMWWWFVAVTKFSRRGTLLLLTTPWWWWSPRLTFGESWSIGWSPRREESVVTKWCIHMWKKFLRIAPLHFIVVSKF